MIKVFELNKNKKIELTKEELEKILNQAYWEGYRSNNNIWTYRTPSIFSTTTTTNNPYNKTNDTCLTKSITIKG